MGSASSCPEPIRYDRVSRLLHWLMAALLFIQIGLGLWMTELPKGAGGARAYWFNVHKSLGMTLGLLALFRLAWAVRRPPVPAVPMAAIQRHLASISHRLLYVLMLLMPASGFLGSVYSGYPVRLFGLTLPKLAERWDAAKAVMSAIHQISAFALMLLVALHLLAVIHHQFIAKDGLLQRMR
ncbi:MAG: cytochrome b [Burkholderiaceae bacterium]